MESQDTEITLGSGRLLGLFFGLALLCGVFFAMGFTLGRNTGGPAPIITPATATPVAATPTLKPAAAKSGAPCPDGQTCDKSSSDELSFIKSDAKTQPAASADATQPDRAEEVAPDPLPAAAAPAAKPAPEMKAPSSGAGFVVQIAAVTKKDDADALLSALRKKNYPVFISADANDHLYHVQVGPYTDRKDASTMKDKLAGDGYNAIVK